MEDYEYILKILENDWDNPSNVLTQLPDKPTTILLKNIYENIDKWDNYLLGDFNSIPENIELSILDKLSIIIAYGKKNSLFKIVFLF